MSLHIYLNKDGNNIFNRIKCSLAFLKQFDSKIKIVCLKLYIDHSNYDDNQIKIFKDINFNSIYEYIQKDIKEEYYNFIELDFDLIIEKNILASLKIYSEKNSKIYGDLELEVYHNKKDNIKEFFDLIKNDIIDESYLTSFFNKFKVNFRLNKAYIDLEEDGETNPLDVPYEYSVDGQKLYRNLFKIIELKADEDEEFEEIYYRLKENEKNYLASQLWTNDIIRENTFNMAKDVNVMISKGSFKLFASDLNSLNLFYKEAIVKIINPLYKNIPSLNERIIKLSKSFEK